MSNTNRLVEGRVFQIDLSTGQLIDAATDTSNARSIQSDQLALWPQYVDDQLECSTSFDAEYFPLDGTYHVNFWYFKERRTGPNSAYAIVVHIIDIQTFVSNSYYSGIWDNALTCDDIFTNIWALYYNAIQPSGLEMVRHLDGMSYSVQCVQWTNDQIDIIDDLYHVCTTDELKEMIGSTNFEIGI